MSHVHGFPPISDSRAKVLILGSMPGKASLKESEYYAHPRNLLWGIVESILGVSKETPYAERCEALKDQGVALWDTLKTCTRSSSLDSDIDESSIVTNDFSTFLVVHPNIELICFNGAKAEIIFAKRVAPELGVSLNRIELLRLPSTSPANASVSVESKVNLWRVIAR
jgi:TDG/mug DNA glycosylase family protein